MADPLRLKQIFLNLVNNALTYTPEGGSVTISARPRKGAYEFDVADTGIGMKKERFQEYLRGFIELIKIEVEIQAEQDLVLRLSNTLWRRMKGRFQSIANKAKERLLQ